MVFFKPLNDAYVSKPERSAALKDQPDLWPVHGSGCGLRLQRRRILLLRYGRRATGDQSPSTNQNQAAVKCTTQHTFTIALTLAVPLVFPIFAPYLLFFCGIDVQESSYAPSRTKLGWCTLNGTLRPKK